MGTWILIMFIATSSSSQAGTASISQEFDSSITCKAAGEAIIGGATNRGNYVLAWGCYKK